MYRVFIIFLILPFISGCVTDNNSTDNDNVAGYTFDGLAQECFDSSVRVRSRGSVGSASSVGYLQKTDGKSLTPVDSILEATHVEFETNRHVAGDRGTKHVLDVWFEGDLVASVDCRTSESWFEQSVGKDLATIVVSLEDLGGPMPIIPLAPYDSKPLKQGDMLFSVGCSDARHPRARCGDVIKIENGLVYYSPKSIPGDSGGALYKFSPERGIWETVGRTAWAIQTKDGWVGLAMTSDRIHDIKSGRVSSNSWELPEGAIPIGTIQDPLKLPDGAVRLDLLQSVALAVQETEDPKPLNVSPTVHRWRFPFKREDIESPSNPPNRIRPLRNWNIFSGIADFVRSLFRYAFITAILLVILGLYISPTILTPLKYDWPIQGFKQIFSIIRKK